MPDLADFQADFAAALQDRTRTPALQRWLAGSAEDVERGMAIYRANRVAAAEKALGAAYPVVRQVVGDEFFDGLARAYQRAAPSTSGDLAAFGAAFDGFLADFEPVREMPWLPDVARLEWAVHRALGAADAPAWHPSALAALGPERQAGLRLHWAPGTALLASSHPIVRLWTIHQPGHAGEFSVDWTLAQTALVSRDDLAVRVDACAPADAAFIAASLAGAPLGQAAAAALERHPGADLAALLSRVFGARLVCGASSP